MKEFSVNLNVFIFSSIYSFISFTLITEGKRRYGIDRKIYYLMSFPFIIRVILNLLSINQDYKTYSLIVNNRNLDYIQWFVLCGILLITIYQEWQRRTSHLR